LGPFHKVGIQWMIKSNIVIGLLPFWFPNKPCACITNFMGHNLTIIIMWNLFFINPYGINIDVIHLLVLFKYWCRVHCLDMNVICLFVLFKHEYCVSICIVYTRKSCTWLLCLNNAWDSCVNNTNPWKILHGFGMNPWSL